MNIEQKLKEEFWDFVEHGPFSLDDKGLEMLLNWFIGKQQLALLEQQAEIVKKITNMKLWSKGTVEGTRQDILHKLSVNLISPTVDEKV